MERPSKGINRWSNECDIKYRRQKRKTNRKIPQAVNFENNNEK